MTHNFLPPHNDAVVAPKPKRPRGRPRLSDEERAARTGPAYQSSYWRQNKAALTVKRKAKIANMTEADREAERRRIRISRKKSANGQKAQIAELLKTIEALSELLEDEPLSMDNVT
jgi:hypothetical protein